MAEQVIALLDQQDQFDDDLERIDDSDDNQLHSTEGDFSYSDGTQSLVNPDLLTSASAHILTQTLPSLTPAELDSILLLDHELNDEESQSGKVCI